MSSAQRLKEDTADAKYKLIIGGKLVDGDGVIEVINPATGKVWTNVAKASTQQVEQAISAATAAQPNWSKTSITVRQACLTKLADIIAANKTELAVSLVHEQGKPLPEAIGELELTESYLRHFATLEVSGRIIQDDEECYIELVRKPLGVVVGILPWNFPVLLACWKIAHATLTGNTIVIKTAPTTPVATLLLGEMMLDVFPPGVVNIITDENDMGPILTSHPDVAKVSFTGSTTTGQKIAANVANSLKRLTLELGGNDPAIVLEDVDVATVAKKIFQAAFANAGQVCLAIKRVYVHESIYGQMCSELAKLAEQAVIGDGMAEGTEIGPLQNKAQYKKVIELLNNASESGHVMTGGVEEGCDGYFVKPTVVRDVADGDRIVDEEQFGPILPVIPYANVEEVIRRANNSEYGLGGSVWSKDISRASEIANRIESGTVWVNQHLNIGPHIPMAGFKQSGLGVEQSIEGLEEFTQLQVINVAK